MNYELFNDDCLEVMKNIPDGSVDLVLTDPPYGTMKGTINRDFSNLKEKDGSYSWDDILPTNELFCEISRILRQNGKCILFSQEPYTSHLVTNQIASLPFSYRAIWYKNTKGTHLMAKSAMVSRYEDICVFSKLGHDYCGENPLREYFAKVYDFIGKPKKQIMEIIGQKADHCFRLNSSQYSLCTEQTYKELIDVFGIDEMQSFIEYEKLRRTQDEYTQKYASVFNLWQGGKSKSNVLEYAKDNDGYHPTQKPVKLLEDLIQTYSNERNTVLDFTMGSGSTGVACVNTNRHFIGIELDEGYFNIAKKRIDEANIEKQNQLW
jgi:site-specific DNA-methyltransferase (adenine-specific)